MNTLKLSSGADFPDILVKTLDDKVVSLVRRTSDVYVESQDENVHVWTLVIVYRGQHCPICTNFLNALDSLAGGFQGIQVNIVAVSADSKEQLQKNIEDDLSVSFPLYHSLALDDMKRLGLYISEPRGDSETDHLFAEPAMFVVNHRNKVQLLNISNGPFARPDVDQLLEGLRYARENEYPIRGTHLS